MKKNAFTLVELLAVITILSIILLIAVPIVANIIKDAKIESLKKSVILYIDAVEKNISSQQTIDPEYVPDKCIIQDNGNVICYKDEEILKVSDDSNELKVPTKGKKPINGTLTIEESTVTDIDDINIDGKFADYDENKNIVLYLYAFPTTPGLYDANRKQVATWEEVKTALGLAVDENGVLYIEDEELVSDSIKYDEDNNIYYRDVDILKKSKILVISNEVKILGEEDSSYGVFDSCISLTNITIPSSVTSIGGWAFCNCSSLLNITIPDSVTSIGEYAFACTNLINVKIPSSVTSIGESAFQDCEKLTSIIIPNSVTSIGESAFHGCTDLISINIPSSLTSIGDSVFEGCTSLKNIVIPDSVTSIGLFAFNGCSGLTNIEIGSGVTQIGIHAFHDCSGTETIKISEENPALEDGGVNAIIYKETKLLTLASKTTVIPNDIRSINSGAFSGYSLTSITIPASVTSIGQYVFENSDNLNSVIFENTTGWKIESVATNPIVSEDIDVTNPETNAINLKTQYSSKSWKRS